MQGLNIEPGPYSPAAEKKDCRRWRSMGLCRKVSPSDETSIKPTSTYLPACLPTCLPAYLPTCLLTYLPPCLPAYLPTCLPTCLPACISKHTSNKHEEEVSPPLLTRRTRHYNGMEQPSQLTACPSKCVIRVRLNTARSC